MNGQRNPEESKRRSSVLAGISALLFTVCLGGYSGYASAATLYAGTCGQNPYATITAAIVHAASGDTVKVCPGSYDEEVTIRKSLTLEGISSDRGTLLPTIRYPHSVDKMQCLPSFFNTCPQILVNDATNVLIRSLNVDGSNYDSGCELAPVGILFYDASGNAQNNTIVNHALECEEGHPTPFIGLGIVGGIDIAGNFSVSASNNTVSNVGEAGIGLTANSPEISTSAKFTGDLIDNVVSLSNPSSIGIASFFTTGVTIAGNKVTSTAEATVGFAIEKGAQDQLIVDNTIEGANAAISLQEVSDSVVTFNTISNTLNVGVAIQCSSNNWITFNQITDVPANIDGWGMYLTPCPEIPSSNDNDIIGNTISGFCTGVLTGAFDDVGNTIAANSFSNIGPGADVMPGFACP